MGVGLVVILKKSILVISLKLVKKKICTYSSDANLVLHLKLAIPCFKNIIKSNFQFVD